MYARTTQKTTLAPAIVNGFGTAIAVWVAWFITHLPWLGLRERDSLIAILVSWLLVLAAMLARFGVARVSVGAASGLVSAITGLLLIGTKIAAPANATAANSGLVPAAPLIVLGFLLLGVAIGLAASFIARPFERRADAGLGAEADPWLPRLALVACAAIAPLLFIGGLVTSTNSGMAVPDWPNTYGSNMLLYPLGPRVQDQLGKSYQQVYFEHSHRLFGMLVGFTMIVFAVWTVLRENRRRVQVLVGVAFVLVCVQGLLGGLRVTENSRHLALIHGFLAQVIFAVVVGAAVVLSPTFRRAAPSADVAVDPRTARRTKVFATALMHAMILQTLLGAGYRHLRSDHVLFTHIALGAVVMFLAVLAGITSGSAAANAGQLRATLARLGPALLAVAILQFLLGIYAWLYGGKAIQPETPLQVIPRVLHQGNGALMIAVATAAFIWARRLYALSRAA